MKPKLNLETYTDEEQQTSKEEPGVMGKISQSMSKIWNKTVFADKIKTAKEEKQFQRELEQEAKAELRPQIKEELKNQIKERELAKIKKQGEKKDIWGKLAKGFEGGGGLGSDEKIAKMLGAQAHSNKHQTDQMFSDDKISKILGGKQINTKQSTADHFDGEYFSDGKISKMLGKDKKKQSNPIRTVDDKISRMMK